MKSSGRRYKGQLKMAGACESGRSGLLLVESGVCLLDARGASRGSR